MSLSLGIIQGGINLDARALLDALQVILSLVARHRTDSDIDTLPELNIVFSVAGDISQPDFDGFRFGRFSSKEQVLLVQVAVNDEVITATEPSEFIFDSIHRAITLAEPMFAGHKLEFDVAKHIEFVRHINRLYSASLY